MKQHQQQQRGSNDRGRMDTRSSRGGTNRETGSSAGEQHGYESGYDRDLDREMESGGRWSGDRDSGRDQDRWQSRKGFRGSDGTQDRWQDRNGSRDPDGNGGDGNMQADGYRGTNGRQSWGGQRGQFTGRGPKGYRRTDERIEEDVNEALTQDGELDAENIEVKVSGGEVTLTGSVDSREAKRRAEDLVESCSGVSDVQNQLKIGSKESQGDGSSGSAGTQSKSKGGNGSSTGNGSRQNERGRTVRH